jgi:hypothetical protein
MSVVQNSGIRIKAFDRLGVKITYYGYIQDMGTRLRREIANTYL